jgi:asparagine synthase (glutamine-hydrolysing)
MCGIAGILRRDDRPADAADALRMVAAMPHRGPDGRGAWADGPVALGHGRLAVRDLTEAAAQPMVAPDGAGTLVYNGEVYDDAALRADLEREGVAFRGTGDAEVLLHALARWGVERTVPRLDGMFAFAWWDARERALWLVRDRFGIKPLHVAVAGGFLAFASEMRGLRAIPGLAAEPDLLEVVRRVLPGLVDETRSLFRGVENVPPGGAWRATRAGLERGAWWDVDRALDVPRLLAASRERPEAWVERVEEAIEAEVRSHLASDVPVAAFTSGGVDGNLVAAIAREGRDALVAYTVDTLSGESETPVARVLAARSRLDLRVVPVDRDAYLAAWPAAVEAHEHPLRHPGQVAALPLFRAARADGFVVALTGEGADELFGGYDFFRRTWEQWRRAVSPFRRFRGSARRGARTLPDAPFDYQSLGRDPVGHLRMTIALAPAEETRARDLLRLLAPVEPPEDRAFLAHLLDSLRRHLGWLLHGHDRLGMAASMEARVPYLSARVGDVALHLPRKAKLEGRVGKWVLKEVAARRLPTDLLHAKKKGFAIPAAHHGGSSALLRGGALPRLLRWTKTAEEDLVPRVERDPLLRHRIVSLEIWARLYAEGETADAIAERLRAASRTA